MNKKIDIVCNEHIKCDRVLLVLSKSEHLVVTLEEGIKRAQADNLDLVQIAHNKEMPVCKITSALKYKKDIRKQQVNKLKSLKVKKLSLSPTIQWKDIIWKLYKIPKWLQQRYQVILILNRFKRMKNYQQKKNDFKAFIQEELKNRGYEFKLSEDGNQIIIYSVKSNC